MGERDQHRERGAVRTGLVVSSVLCVAELVGGWLTNSLALLTDATHMLTDVGALALTLFALRLAERPASGSKTYGYVRAEILAALVNGVVLCVLVLVILWEAWTRVQAPPPVRAEGMSAPMPRPSGASNGASVRATGRRPGPSTFLTPSSAGGRGPTSRSAARGPGPTTSPSPSIPRVCGAGRPPP